MRRFFALALCALPFVVHAQNVFRAVDRRLDQGTYNHGSVRMLPNGNFVAAMQGFDEDSTRLYIFNRNGGVVAIQNLVNVRTVEVKVHPSGRIYVVGNLLLAGNLQNSYVGCFNQNGVGQWARVIDIAGNDANDGASDVDFNAAGDAIVTGFVVAAPSYAYCLSLNGTTGAQNFKVARADVASGRDIAVAPNGTIHIGSNTDYWRLSTTGQTLTAVAHPTGVTTTDIAVDDQSVYICGRRLVSGRNYPWIQRRSSTGIPIWAQYDPACVGAGVMNLTDNYLYEEIDNSGYVHVKGTMAVNGAQVSRYARYSPAGALVNSVTRPAYFGNGVLGRQMALDPFNEVYTIDNFFVQGQPTNQTELTRYAPYPLAPRWRDLLYDSPNGGGAGSARSIAVHAPSGDIIALLGLTDVPNRVSVQVFRQQAMPVADHYVITAPGAYNSTHSVLTNDRYREGAKLQLVSGPTKGALNLSVNTGNFTYTPNMGATGTDKFVYRLKKDGLVGTATTVTLALP